MSGGGGGGSSFVYLPKVKDNVVILGEWSVRIFLNLFLCLNLCFVYFC